MVDSSTNRNVGTTNINPTLLADLKQRTTYPPILITNVVITESATWYPVAQRDTDLPDLGYHYDSLDFLLGGIVLSNATMLVTNGAAIGIDAAATNYGLRLDSGASLISEGTPINLNHFVRTHCVQELSSGSSNNPANINCRVGTILFWFRPNWNSGTGPGTWGRFIERGNTNNPSDGWWALSVNASGNEICFETEKGGTNYHTIHFTNTINWTTSQWHHIALTYTNNATQLYLDGQLAVTGSGVMNYPVATARAAGFSIGSNHTGNEQARGRFEDLKTFNYVLTASLIASDYNARAAMDLANYSIYLPSRINTNSVFVGIDGAPTASVAYLVNSTNFASATWLPFNSFTLTNLSATNDIWIGFTDQTGVTNWLMRRIVVDTVPPQAFITGPPMTNAAGTVVTRPLIQLQGYTLEDLARLSYSLTNAADTNTDAPGFILRTDDDPTGQYSTNWFQCFDLDLAPGTNRIFLRLEDTAGNVTVTNLTCILSYSGVTSAPVILSCWLTNGSLVGGTNFTLRGYLDDPTAVLHASITSTGQTNQVDGLVERDGLFWVESLPLNAKTNHAAGLATNVTFTVFKSAVQLTMTNLATVDLTQPAVQVQGTINSGDYTVWVNDVKVTNIVASGRGYIWSATDVPVSPGGTATFHAIAIPNSDNGGNGTPAAEGALLDNVGDASPASAGATKIKLDQEAPSLIDIKSYSGSLSVVGNWDACTKGSVSYDDSYNIGWGNGNGGLQYGVDKVWHCVDFDHHSIGLDKLEWEKKWEPKTYYGQYQRRSNDGEWTGWQDFDDDGNVIFPPDFPYEHCVVTDYGSGDLPDTYVRKGQTKIRLHTGGKGFAKRKNLFTIRLNAYEILNKRAGLVPVSEESMRPISPASSDIILPGLYGAKLGADGLLHIMLADNAVLNATPWIKGGGLLPVCRPRRSTSFS